MKHPRHIAEIRVPMHTRDDPDGAKRDSRPQIRRLIERLAKKLDIDYDDLVELHISFGRVAAVYYDRNEGGQRYRDEFNKVVVKQKQIEVDTYTYLGDETEI